MIAKLLGSISVPVFTNIIQDTVRGLQSKRPQVKTSPSQNVPILVKTSPKIGQNVPMLKHVGQNVPKMNFYSICYEILGIIWDV